MKILRLRIQGFGPYVSPQDIDFTQLRDAPIFLITGPTGGGKTTLLDAICFALYGEASGGSREGRELRSDFASPIQQTQVTLDFSIGQELYRVHRTPPQVRPKKSGQGTTEAPPSATLWRRTGARIDSDEGAVLASKPADVTQEAQRLLGFQVGQFRQVVLLPQGDFEKFLAANSKQREEILQVLFQTERYRLLEEALKQRSKSIEQEIAAKLAKQETLLLTEDAASIDDLQARCTASEQQRDALEVQEKSLAAEELAATDALDIARATQQKLVELSSAAATRQQLAARSSEIEGLRRRLQSARRAAPLVELDKAAATRQEELRLAIQAAQNATTSLELARQGHESAQAALAAETLRDPDRTAAGEQIQRLSELKPVVEDLRTATLGLEKVRTLHAKLKEQCNSAEAQIASLTNQLQQAGEATRAAELSAAGLQGNELHLKALQQERQQRTRHDKAQNELSGAIMARERAQTKLQASEQSLEAARLQVDQLQAAWLSGQAAALADSLVAGAPCPVCGSPDHPSPASAHAGAPEKSALESQQAKLRKCEKEREAASAARQDADPTVIRLQLEFDNLVAALGQRAALPLATIDAELATATALRDQASAAAAAITELRQRATKSEFAVSEEKTKLAGLTQQRELAAQQQSAAAQSVGEGEARVPEPLRPPNALDQAIRNAQAHATKLQKALQSAQANVQKAGQTLASAESTGAAAESARLAAAAALETAKAEFSRRLLDAGFTAHPEYAVAAADFAAIDSLDKQVSRFDQELAAAIDRLARATTAAEGLTAPDLPAHELRLATAKQQRTALKDQLSVLRALILRQRKLLKTLRAAAVELERLAADQQAYGHISQVALGSNTRKVTFQQFVQSTLFDDVLQSASLRLSRMSKGRFDLCRPVGPADGRTTAGLDIRVSDSHSGTDRSVSTLSGGEKFLASLSLALGLADVVQSYSGGIHLESLFIDEGFGSLDPESLDHAIATLTELRQSGRSIGIISHVGELKERIPARIEVSSQGGVSSLSVIV